jgi:hypothetical protein
MNIERKKDTDARRLLWGIVNRRRRIDGFRVVIGLPIHGPVIMPLATVSSVISVPPTIIVIPGKRRGHGHSAHHRSNGECHHELADRRPEIPDLICRGFHCALPFLVCLNDSLPVAELFILRVPMTTCSF